MRPVILGMNSRTGETLGLFDTRGAGRRLFEASGMRLLEYTETFERINLLEEPEWSALRARTAAPTIRLRVRGRRVVVLGREAWSALSLPRVDLLTWHHEREGTSWAQVPHPSGLNRWYNDPSNVTRVASFFATFTRRDE